MKRIRGAMGTTLAATLALLGCTITTPRVVHTPTVTTAGCPAQPSGTPPPPLTAASSTAQDEQVANLVLTTPRPARDLYAITQQIVKHLPTPIPHVVRSTPRDEQVGNMATFWVTNPNQIGYHQVTAQLVYETPHVYMYVESGAQAPVSAIKASADLFERQIFATDEATFGPHWSPGVDDDPHVTVLNATNLGNVGGYFSSEDEYPHQVFAYSNERQMIYINLDGGAVPGEEFYNATLAHEFQHMIHWYWHPSDPSWANEGMSVLAQHLNHFTTDGLETDFLQFPDTMLGGWTDDTPSMATHYGAGYLFNDYFAEHYGGYGVLRELLTDPAQAPLNYDDVLAKHGSKDDFNAVFAKFAIANLLNDPNVAGGIYAYPSIPGEKAHPQALVSTYPYGDGTASAPATVQQYGTEYYDLKPPSNGAASTSLSINFTGAPETRIVNNQPYGGAANEWWSNTGNNMDSTLTHVFDLSALAGKPVTLTFKAWYDLEPSFDYAYVDVSTDGGQNWTTLPTTTSCEANPNGANLGHGMTNPNGDRAGCSLVAQWQDERVDLSAYAGKRILLRFETTTDDAVHCQGLTLDDIQIPELGFKDDLSKDNGWQAAGFIRSNNVMAQRYAVQAVLYPASGGTPAVMALAVDPQTGMASTTIGNFGTYAHVTVAISAMAPATVVPASYQFSARLA